MVGQETDAALERHDLCRERQQLDLPGREHIPAFLEKALGIFLEQVKVAVYLGQILLILRGGIGTETDAVPKIVEGEPRHDGVEVDDCNRSAGDIVKHDVVELGIVVSHPQRKFSSRQQVDEPVGVGLPGAYESDLGLHVGRAAGRVFRHRFLKVFVAVGGVVEVGDDLMQGLGRIRRQQTLEFSERACGIIEMLRLADGLESDGVLDENETAPVLALLVLQIQRAVLCGDELEAFPVGIAALGEDAFLQKGGDMDHIVHQLGHIGKHVFVHPLEDIPPLGIPLPPAADAIGIVDMAAAVRLGVHGLALQGKTLGYGQGVTAHRLFILSLGGVGPSQSLSG